MSDALQKFSTYALTLRPRNGVTDLQVSVLYAWIIKRSTHYYVVTEKKDHQRHVHAAVYLKTPVSRSHFVQAFTRFLSTVKAKGSQVKVFELDVEEMAVARKGVRIMYNNDFVENYLDKDDDTVVIGSCLPEMALLNQFYPPKPEESTVRKAKKCSAYYHQLEELWNKYKRPLLEVNTVNCRNFLFNMMYNERCINVIRDDKTITQTARHLTRWLNRATECTYELAPFENEE